MDAETAPPQASEEVRSGCGSTALPLLRWRDGAALQQTAEIADEVPVAFEYNGVSHAVMLATPRDLEDFAIGFSLSEGIVEARPQLYGIEARNEPDGITLAIDIAADAFARLKGRRRTLAGRTGCGICGAESLAQVLRPLPQLQEAGPFLTPAALRAACSGLSDVQPLQRATGATHGAAWCALDGRIEIAREDVGRHNALDKLIGALAIRQTDARGGFALVTSRASVEMVQKAAMAGIALLAAVSAPTVLAVRVAQECGVTLIGFARGAEFSVYTHLHRLQR